ncbi:hypothetical protein ACFV2S_06090 [Streptomyces sp. NPDC059695]|uniref:hypothetical protein n=1 Tax=Streptomyces sp. NPDC059695 TaxID=3346910 RepID=UPI0036AC324C
MQTHAPRPVGEHQLLHMQCYGCAGVDIEIGGYVQSQDLAFVGMLHGHGTLLSARPAHRHP